MAARRPGGVVSTVAQSSRANVAVFRARSPIPAAPRVPDQCGPGRAQFALPRNAAGLNPKPAASSFAGGESALCGRRVLPGGTLTLRTLPPMPCRPVIFSGRGGLSPPVGPVREPEGMERARHQYKLISALPWDRCGSPKGSPTRNSKSRKASNRRPLLIWRERPPNHIAPRPLTPGPLPRLSGGFSENISLDNVPAPSVSSTTN